MLLISDFLKFKPSQIAAVSLLLGIRIATPYRVSCTIELEKLLFDNNRLKEPQEMWNNHISALTHLDFSKDLEAVYQRLMCQVNITDKSPKD